MMQAAPKAKASVMEQIKSMRPSKQAEPVGGAKPILSFGSGGLGGKGKASKAHSKK